MGLQAFSCLELKDFELQPHWSKSAKLYEGEVKCAHAILDLGALRLSSTITDRPTS